CRVPGLVHANESRHRTTSWKACTAMIRAVRGSFGPRLAAIAVLGAALRLGYVLGLSPTMPSLSDGPWFREVSYRLVHGQGYTQLLDGALVPTATHPPLYPLW